jgi:hypothetical protein
MTGWLSICSAPLWADRRTGARARRISLGALAVLLSLVAPGCAEVWTQFNRPGLEADGRHLLLAAGVESEQLSCGMIGSTRTGFCIGSLPQTWSTPVELPGLQRVTSRSPEELRDRMDAWEAEGGCRTLAAFQDPAQTIVFISERRPPDFDLPSGGSPEYVMIYLNTTGQQACVQLSYAYG